MRVKTSITLSQDVLKKIDRRGDAFRSRSEFFEAAARRFLKQLAHRECEKRDLIIINKRADALNAEAEDVLGCQATVRQLGTHRISPSDVNIHT